MENPNGYFDCDNNFIPFEVIFRKIVVKDGDGYPVLYTTTDPDGTALRTDAAGGGVTYYGYAPVGTNPAAAAWKIKRTTVAGGLTTNEYADGDREFDNVWNDRAALSYS